MCLRSPKEACLFFRQANNTKCVLRHISPIKNQSVQFTLSKKEFWHICNSSEQKIANRQTQTFLKINRARKKVSRLKDENVEKTKFTFLLYSRLPPRQYMTRVDKRDRLLKSCPEQAAVGPWGSRGLRRIMRWRGRPASSFSCTPREGWKNILPWNRLVGALVAYQAVSYTHLTLPTIYSV